MAYEITEDCINCDACRPECPTESITVGDGIYVIDPNTCVECVGFYDSPQCADLCPVDCCVQA